MKKDELTLSDAVTKLKAVGDATRARVLLCLQDQPLCLDHLTRVLGLAPSTLSAHLRVLFTAGLVEVTQEGHWRYYHLPSAGVDAAGDELVRWLNRHVADSVRASEDRSLRTVALGESDAPVPSFLQPKVLFLCTGNSCRSQMAEGLLRRKAGARFEVHSAGLAPRAIADLTFVVMDEIGIDIRQQSSKDVLTYLGHLSFEYIITVCPDADARCPVFPGAKNRLCWPVDDPVAADGTGEERLTVFRKTRDELARRIDTWLRELDEDHESASSSPT